jgi:hypothetical protein
MAETFTFAGDVAPLQRRFFGAVQGSRNISSAQKGKLLAGEMGNQLKFSESLLKLQNEDEERKMRDLRFDEATTRLGKFKEDIERQRNVDRDLGLLQRDLESIVNDPDEKSKQRRLSVFGVQNAAKLSASPTLTQAYSAASYGVNRGTPAKPEITYGELIEKGADASILGMTEETDLTSAVPPLVAQKAYQGIYSGRASQKEALAKQEADEKAQARLATAYNNVSRNVASWDNTTPPESVEFTGRQALSIFGTLDDVTEFDSVVSNARKLQEQKNYAEASKLFLEAQNMVRKKITEANPLTTRPEKEPPPAATNTRSLFSPSTK